MLPERITGKIDASGDCWEWTGSRRKGYGRVWADERPQQAHRVVWAVLVGPIPEGLTLDHLCRNRACVNPDHLEPVTVGANVLRSPITMPNTPPNAKKTHCPRGHAYTPENTWTSYKGRTCKACQKERRLRARLVPEQPEEEG